MFFLTHRVSTALLVTIWFDVPRQASIMEDILTCRSSKSTGRNHKSMGLLGYLDRRETPDTFPMMTSQFNSVKKARWVGVCKMLTSQVSIIHPWLEQISLQILCFMLLLPALAFRGSTCHLEFTINVHVPFTADTLTLKINQWFKHQILQTLQICLQGFTYNTLCLFNPQFRCRSMKKKK